MRKMAFLLIVLMGLGFASITLDAATVKAQQYQETGETIDMEPQGLTYSGATSYWVIELKGSLGVINVLLPINSETGNVEVSSSIQDVLKTHYLANYLVNNEGISDFLDATLSYAQSKQTDFTNAINQLGIFKAQLPADAYLVNLDPLIDSLAVANSANDDLRHAIQDAQATISPANWRTTDVNAAQNALDDVFAKEKTFLDALDSTAALANAFVTELASSSLKTDHADLVQAFQSTVSTNKLSEGSTVQRRDSLTSNKNAIDSFFSSLDLTSSQYLAKLRDRYENHISQTDILAITNAITTYQANYTYISSSADYISPAHQSSITDLVDLINTAQGYATNKNYTEAKAQFSEIDDLIETLIGYIGECPLTCANGKIATSSCTCACPKGMTETSGKCVSTGFTLNPYLIGGLLLIIIALIAFKYKDKIFKGGEKVEKKSDDMWAGYKF